MAFWWPMLRNSIVGFVFSPTAVGEAASQLELWLFLAASAVLALAFAFTGKTGKESTKHGAVLAACVTASILNLVVLLTPATQSPVVLAADALVIACSYVVLPVAWGAVLLDMWGKNPKRLLLVLAASYAASFVIGYLSYLPSPFDLIRPIGAPAFSALAWAFCRTGRTSGSVAMPLPAIGKRNRRSLYVLVLVLFLVSSVATGFINTGSVLYLPSADTFVRDTLNIGVTLCIVAVIAFSRHLEKVKFSLIVVLSILLFGGIFVATLFRQDWFSVGTGLIQTSKSCFSLLLFALVLLGTAQSAKGGGRKAILLLFVLPTTLSSFISYLAVPFFTEAFHVSYNDFWGLFSLLMGFLLGVFLFGFLSSVVIQYLPNDDSEAKHVAENEAVAETIGTTYELTGKEHDVLLLLLEGNTYKKIATLLYVSDSTVQSHAKSIYRKLDVHTKQELIDLAARVRTEL